jgi:hypothetical protein
MVGQQVGHEVHNDARRMNHPSKADKQVPPLRIAIDEANRSAPVGMTNSY